MRPAQGEINILGCISVMKKTFFYASCAIAIAGCGKNEPGGPPPTVVPVEQVRASAPQGPKAAAFSVKGLSIGVDIQGVPDAFTDMLAQQELSGYGFTDVIQYTNGERCVLLYDKRFLGAIEARMRERYDLGRAQQKINEELQSSCYASDGVVVVKAGADGKVSRIEFNAVGELFNAKDLAPADFAKLLVKEYSIPALKPNSDHSGWQYIAPDGTRVEVVVKKIFGATTSRLYLSRAAG